jgi:hypothetical protein
VGTFNFNGTLLPTTCVFAGNGTVNTAFPFTGTFTTEPGGIAWLCIDTPHAEPRRGTHAGDVFDVSYRNVGATVNPCTCPVDVVETIRGTVSRGDGGTPTGFDGGMESMVEPSVPLNPPSTPDGGVCNCGLNCALEYDLTAQPAQAP